MMQRHSQQGVAVIMALLLTTLAITIVASLFWQQQVQVRAIENQRLQLQKQWILRGALDWASLILREDVKHSNTDTLDEPWAVPLAETRLDQYVENGKADSDVADTVLSGSINDAQGRMNLSNLCPNGSIDPTAVLAYAQLLKLLNLDPALAQNTAQQMAYMPQANNLPALNSASAIGGTSSVATTTAITAPNTFSINPAASAIIANNTGAQTIAYTQVEDLLAVPDYTPTIIEQLRPYVIFLPNVTPINVNTAPAEVLAAMIGVTLDDANILVSSRKSASFRDLADFSTRLPNKAFNANNISVNSSYFLINGKVRMNRAQLDIQALMSRNGTVIQPVWIREF